MKVGETKRIIIPTLVLPLLQIFITIVIIILLLVLPLLQIFITIVIIVMIYIYIYIYINIIVIISLNITGGSSSRLSWATARRAAGASDRLISKAARPAMMSTPTLRPISVLKLRISEGLTQAES